MRARLLASVIACVRERGPRVSVDELARAGGVSKPVLYDVFGDRRGIAIAVASELADTIERDLWASLDGRLPQDPGRLIRRLVATVLDIVSEDTNLYHFTVQHLRTSGSGLLDNPLAARLHDRASALIAQGSSTVEVGAGAILADGLFGLLLAATESWLAQGEGVARDSLVDLLSNALHAAWVTVAGSDTGGGSPLTRPGSS